MLTQHDTAPTAHELAGMDLPELINALDALPAPEAYIEEMHAECLIEVDTAIFLAREIERRRALHDGIELALQRIAEEFPMSWHLPHEQLKAAARGMPDPGVGKCPEPTRNRTA